MSVLVLRFYLTFIFICLNLIIQAQVMRDGYVITHENDTIRGRISFSEGERKFYVCRLYIDSTRTIMHFIPEDIKGYVVTGVATFVSRPITVLENRGFAFAEVLVSGRMKLLAVKDHLFIEKRAVLQLVRWRAPVTKDSDQSIPLTKDFKSVLANEMFDYPDAPRLIENSDTTVSKMKKLVIGYNNYIGELDYVARRRWFQFEAGVSGAASIVTLRNVSSSAFGGLADPSKFGSDYIMFPGLSMEFGSPFTKRLRFHVDVFYQKHSFQALYGPISYTRAFSWSYQTVAAPITGVFYFGDEIRKIRPFAELGVELEKRFGDEYRMREDKFIGNTSYISTSSTQFTTDENFNVLGVAGGGVSWSITPVARAMARVRLEGGPFAVGNSSATRLSYTLGISLLVKLSK